MSRLKMSIMVMTSDSATLNGTRMLMGRVGIWAFCDGYCSQDPFISWMSG
jgi:hypothetical protein